MPDDNLEPSWASPEGVCALSTKTSGYYAVQLPDNGVDDDTTLLCTLHGWGQNSRSFLRRFETLREQNVVVVAPQGSNQFYLDMESKKVGFSWLTVYDRNRAMLDIFDFIEQVVGTVSEAHGIKMAPIMLGFSQGVSIAFRYHLLGRRPVGGIVACGGDLPPDVRGPLKTVDSLPVLLVHGRDDGIVPIAKAEESRECLRETGLTPEEYFFDGGHEISRECARHISAWATALD
jgi:predicted esterase